MKLYKHLLVIITETIKPSPSLIKNKQFSLILEKKDVIVKTNLLYTFKRIAIKAPLIPGKTLAIPIIKPLINSFILSPLNYIRTSKKNNFKSYFTTLRKYPF